MDYQITTITAAILSLWLIILSSRVITARRNTNDDKSKETLNRRMRGQANFIEYTPMMLMLLFLAEHASDANWWLMILAGIFVFARLCHGYAFAFMDHWAFGRIGGTFMTYFVLMSLALTNLWLVLV